MVRKGEQLMKIKNTLTLLLVVLVVGMLSACGSSSAVGGLKSGEIIEISYDELIEKLDNEETFLLLPTSYSYEDFVDSGLSQEIEKRLEDYGVGIYYTQTYFPEKNEDRDDGLDKYLHPENEKYDGISVWIASGDGLVYVNEGKVITLTSYYDFKGDPTTPFGKQTDMNDSSNHVYYADSISQSLMKYESLDLE